MKMLLSFLLMGWTASVTADGPGSCVSRCSEVFSRGRPCSCDSSCLQFNECCSDFLDVCSSALSCRGRCGESFLRGRRCECDPQCSLYNTCCHDYQAVCASPSKTVSPVRPAASGNRKSKKNRKDSDSESEERSSGRTSCSAASQCPSRLLPPVTSDLSGQLQPGVRSPPHLSSGPPDTPASGSSLPSLTAPSAGSSALYHLLLSPDGASAPAVTRPGTLQELGGSLAGQGLSDLCSDSPINGLTSLSDGTILVFKGDWFWSVDPVSRSVGHPQNITHTLGVPSPIDTVFTRCNCHGDTYVIKGDQYWRLDGTMALEPGFPRPLTSEFPGLTGVVAASLPVPASGGRPETVFFFIKDGDTMQSFTFPPGGTASCSRKPRNSWRRRTPQPAVLSRDINIRTSLDGFPTPVTSALSLRRPQRRDTYEHYVFSGPLFFSLQMSGDLPALAAPAAHTLQPVAHMADGNKPQQAADNSLRGWLRCPE